MRKLKEAICVRALSDSYRVGDVIGKGSFGKVFLGQSKITKENVAIKQIDKKDMMKSELALQMNEIDILKVCNHHNVVKLLDVFEDFKSIFMIIEYLPGGNLFTYSHKNGFHEDSSKSMIQ